MKLFSVIFYSNDLAVIKDFYVTKFALKIDYETPTFISFLFDENVKLGVKLAKESRELPGSQTIIVQVKDIRKTFYEFKKVDVVFSKELKEEPWGIEFSILDPDGNKIIFRS